MFYHVLQHAIYISLQLSYNQDSPLRIEDATAVLSFWLSFVFRSAMYFANWLAAR